MTLITFEDGKVVFRDGAVGTEQACCCAGGQCCCVGTSAISFDENLEPTGEPCQDIEEIDSGESCDGEQVNKPDTAQSCANASVVVEWCDLTVVLEHPFVTSQDSVVAPNSPFPPPLCTGDGVDVYRQALFVGDSQDLGDPVVENFSDCEFGCFVKCNSLLVRIGVLLDETPGIGAARQRLYYVTLRQGCDDAPVIETVYNQGAYCCPEEPEITITIAP